MRKLARSHFVSAVVGGLLVAGGFLIFGVTGGQRTETIVEEAPVAAQTAANRTSGLTPHDIYQRDAPGVVFVRAKLIEQVQSPFNPFHSQQSGVSTGSGFVVDRSGDILTNYHVIDGALRSGGVTVGFENNVARGAGVVAVDQQDDLAVLHVDMRGVPPVRPLALGDSTSVRVGDPTLAIGNPFGVDRTLTSGIVSALQHQIQATDGLTINNVIQTDQPVTPGNSGGPLLDADGRVIGINSQVATAGGAAGETQRLPFAVPIDTADEVLARIDRGAPVRFAYIGLSDAAPASTRGGAVVAGVTRGGPAAAAGVRRGDTIERIDGLAVQSVHDVLTVVATRSPGESVLLQVRRSHRRRTVTVVLGSATAPKPEP